VIGKEIPWRYRSSGLQNSLVLGGSVELVPTDPERAREELQFYLKKRREGTPFDEPCCGSVFRNPSAETPLRTAGQLVEACGLKGRRVGDAEVSPKHANYIVNLGSATAADVLGLMRLARDQVQARFGITLEPEVKLVGFTGAQW
jgi:UDP-N-acetylmuramate dehydrogenase